MRKRKGRIVHGGSPRDTRLPDEQDAKLPAFIDSVEELVRLGIRKGLSMKQDGTKLRQAEYWVKASCCQDRDAAPYGH